MRTGDRCGECNAVIAADSPGGLCGRCMLSLGLDSIIASGTGDSASDGQPSVIREESPREIDPHPPRASPASRALLAGARTEQPGDRIGRYRVLQEIGHGGCGVVYLAEQEEPVRRRVALKVVKLGMDTRQVVARFRAEQQALALMNHPNIAKVFDAGATVAGRPYFVMELVQGVRITEYCDRNKVPIGDRLNLFIKVCQAIQHAHQKGVIHRDIKPSNILVTLQDGAAVPKVIDFGIAKATQGRLTDQTLFTAVELFVGTPAYMSPEQVDLSGLDIDTRSDIYSLGILLYELLVGATPFAAEELLAGGLDRMRATIREQAPERPSTRLKAMETEPLASTAETRQTDSSKLVHLVRGDLDWIVMKCLEKDRTRRYETANALAMDLQRHLAEEPILARPPSTIYRVQKFLRRNQAMVTFGAVVTAVLVIGILELLQLGQIVSVAVIGTVLVLGILWSTREAIRARRAEREQERSRFQAEAARENEARQRELAQAHEQIARRRAYASDMSAAWQSFLEGDVTRTRDLLERQRPLPGQPGDFRGFEWCYLWGLSRPDELFILSDRPASAVKYSPDGCRVALAGDDGVVSLWDAQGQGQLASFQASTSDVASIAFSPDGRLLATASRFEEGDKVKLWNLEAARPHAITLPGHRQEADVLAFSPNGQRLVSVGATPYTKGIPPEIRIWDVASAKEEFQLFGHQSWIRCASFSPDSRFLATGDGDGWVKIWDLVTQKERQSLPGHHGFVSAATFSPTGHFLATADEYGTIILWNWPDGTVASVLSAHRAPIYELAISRDGRMLATASRDHTAKLFDIQTRAELATFRGHSDRVRGVDFSPDGQSLATSGSNVRVWRAAPKADSFIFSPEKSTGTVRFSPDGKFLVQELWNSNRVVLWDSRSKHPVKKPLSGRDAVFSLDGELFLMICGGQIVVHDATNFLPRGTIALAAPVSGPMACSPDGKFLVARRGSQQVIVDLEARREIQVLEGTTEEYAPVIFSMDSKQLITAGPPQGSIRVWDTATWEARGLMRGHKAAIEALAIFQDGQTLASGGHDRTVRLWDLVTCTAAAGSVLPSNAGAVTRLACSSDRMTLAIGTYDGAIKLWNIAAQEEVGALRGHASIIRGLAFSPDGRMLASSSYDGIFRVWTAPSLPETSVPISDRL